MVDYYVELKLNPADSLTEIRNYLNNQERIWRHREVNNPDKATMMLALILQAKNIFSSESSRRAYDTELAESKQPKDPPIKDSDQAYIKLERQARSYFLNGEYDLAKVAVDRALSLNNDESNDSLFDLAAGIYYKNNDYNSAIQFINKAIVENPNKPEYFFNKGLVLWDLANSLEKYSQIIDRDKQRMKTREVLEVAVKMAKRNGNTAIEANATGLLARSLYFFEPTDQARAEQLALQAQALGESAGNVQIILDNINARNAEEEKRKNTITVEKMRNDFYQEKIRVKTELDQLEREKEISINAMLEPYLKMEREIQENIDDLKSAKYPEAPQSLDLL